MKKNCLFKHGGACGACVGFFGGRGWLTCGKMIGGMEFFVCLELLSGSGKAGAMYFCFMG